jgi:hypothetical protein
MADERPRPPGWHPSGYRNSVYTDELLPHVADGLQLLHLPELQKIRDLRAANTQLRFQLSEATHDLAWRRQERVRERAELKQHMELLQHKTQEQHELVRVRERAELKQHMELLQHKTQEQHELVLQQQHEQQARKLARLQAAHATLQETSQQEACRVEERARKVRRRQVLHWGEELLQQKTSELALQQQHDQQARELARTVREHRLTLAELRAPLEELRQSLYEQRRQRCELCGY